MAGFRSELVAKVPFNFRNVTGFGLLAVLLGLLLYDVLPFLSEPEGDTVSEVLGGAPQSVILLAGFFLGHFWPVKSLVRSIWQPPDPEPAGEG
jgi:hypothetical protein